MPIAFVLVLAVLAAARPADAQSAAPASPASAAFITPADIAGFLESGIVKSAVDQPIRMTPVRGGLATVAMLHRDRAEAGALIHERATETYYILQGSGTMTVGGTLGGAKPTDLTRLGAGPSLTGTRDGGDSRHVGPGDVVVIPAGTVHSFSALDSPISYLVFRFDPQE
ncbi:MAG: cupin domain-containing protein [Vicinamibacterales bacterium]